MKILAIGDPHGKLPKNLNGIIKKNKIDVIICVGDYGFTPNKPWLEESWKGIKRKFIDDSYKNVVDKFCSYGLPVLTLRGNMYQCGGKRFADKILKKNKNLINKFIGKQNIKGQNFVFFDVLYESSTLNDKVKIDQFTRNKMKSNNSREKRLNKLLKENSNAILIAHNPPYGFVDKAHDGKHVGSKILLNAIKKHQPKLVLCGHIHEAKGKAKIGKVPVYNLGWHEDYAIFDVGEKVKFVGSNFLNK